MTHQLNLKKCDPSKVAHRFHVAFLLGTIAAAQPKGDGILVPGTLLDQGGSGTCHTHSLCGACDCALKAQSTPAPFFGSPRTLASCVYADVRSPKLVPGGQVPPLTDDGADLQDDATALAGWGLAPIQAPTSDGRYSDVENDPPNNVFPEVDPSQLQRAFQVSGEYQIPVDGNAAKNVALCIDAGIPVQIGIFVDTAFERLTSGEIAQPANQNDPKGGGHALYIYGYRTNAEGQYEFRVRNSWGSSWCDSGDFWASAAWVASAWELFPIAVKMVPKGAA